MIKFEAEAGLRMIVEIDRCLEGKDSMGYDSLAFTNLAKKRIE